MADKSDVADRGSAPSPSVAGGDQKSAQHTPGPWEILTVTCKGSRNRRAIRGKTRAICNISLDDDEQEANARLIAAAPDMLAALVSVERFLTETWRDGWDDFHPHAIQLRAVRDAIQTAEEGRS